MAEAEKALRIAKLHPTVTDSEMMLMTMRIINRSEGGDYREQSGPLVITPSGGSNYGHHGNHHANLATCSPWSVRLRRAGKQCL